MRCRRANRRADEPFRLKVPRLFGLLERFTEPFTERIDRMKGWLHQCLSVKKNKNSLIY